MDNINLIVQNYFEVSRNKITTEFFILLTQIFDFSPIFLIVLSLVILIVYMRKGFGNAFYVFTNFIVAGLLILILKEIFGVERPMDGVVIAKGNSFPSYHATVSSVLLLSVNYVFKEHRLSKKIFIPFSILLALLVSFSRIYLGVHWVSDVVAGIFIAFLIYLVNLEVFKKNKIL